MTAIDSCEPQIIHALEKDGWQIVDKPYAIPAEDHPVYADLRGQLSRGDELQTVVIVEAKCFTNPKLDLPELYAALGQYIYYRVTLHRANRFCPLYLALPAEAYLRFYEKPTFMDAFAHVGVKLLVVDTDLEEVVGWLD